MRQRAQHQLTPNWPSESSSLPLPLPLPLHDSAQPLPLTPPPPSTSATSATSVIPASTTASSSLSTVIARRAALLLPTRHRQSSRQNHRPSAREVPSNPHAVALLLPRATEDDQHDSDRDSDNGSDNQRPLQQHRRRRRRLDLEGRSTRSTTSLDPSIAAQWQAPLPQQLPQQHQQRPTSLAFVPAAIAADDIVPTSHNPVVSKAGCHDDIVTYHHSHGAPPLVYYQNGTVGARWDPWHPLVMQQHLQQQQQQQQQRQQQLSQQQEQHQYRGENPRAAMLPRSQSMPLLVSVPLRDFHRAFRVPLVAPDDRYHAFLLGRRHHSHPAGRRQHKNSESDIEIRFSKQCLAQFCFVYSAVAVLFLLWAGLMLDLQPLYIKGSLPMQLLQTDDGSRPVKQFLLPGGNHRLKTATTAYQTATAYFITMLISYTVLHPSWWNGRRANQYQEIPDHYYHDAAASDSHRSTLPMFTSPLKENDHFHHAWESPSASAFNAQTGTTHSPFLVGTLSAMSRRVVHRTWTAFTTVTQHWMWFNPQQRKRRRRKQLQRKTR